jgi:hypothetical protein
MDFHFVWTSTWFIFYPTNFIWSLNKSLTLDDKLIPSLRNLLL